MGTLGLHILVAIFTVWWTLGIGNAIYALIAHYTAPEVLVKMDEPGYPGGYGAPPGYQPIPPQGGPRPPQ